MTKKAQPAVAFREGRNKEEKEEKEREKRKRERKIVLGREEEIVWGMRAYLALGHMHCRGRVRE